MSDRPPSQRPANRRARYARDAEHRERINARARARYALLTPEQRRAYQRKLKRAPDEERPINKLKREIGRCQRCGYDRCIGALDWHHKDENGGGRRRPDPRRFGWERARAYVAECILLCANCHREEHFG